MEVIVSLRSTIYLIPYPHNISTCEYLISLVYRVLHSRVPCSLAFFTCFLLHFSTQSATDSQPGQHTHRHTHTHTKGLTHTRINYIDCICIAASLHPRTPALLGSIMKMHFVAILIEWRNLRFIGQRECSLRRVDGAFFESTVNCNRNNGEFD